MKKNLLHRSLSRSVTSGSSSSGSYTVNLNEQWEKTTAISNPNSSIYDGVFRSASNYNVNNGVATMYITIKDCNSFRLYIRSYAESSFDYVMVSQLDKTITGNTSLSDTTLVKAHTRGNQQSGTAIGDYTLVEFTGISSGEHTITIVYRKDSSVNKDDDRGYVLIDKSSVNSGESGDEGGSNEGLIDIANYLTIEALKDGLTVSLSDNTCEYCVDGDGNWKTLRAGVNTESINTGQTLSFKGNLEPNETIGIGTFNISKQCNLLGNCMSMLYGDDSINNSLLKDYSFYKLFSSESSIVTVSKNFLPATTLAKYCYSLMFYKIYLKQAPALPATTLAEGCYLSMFAFSSLTTAPVLPATTLAKNCYNAMFHYCTSLTTAPELPATTLAEGCYSNMFWDCQKLTTAPVLPATTLAKNCYMYMFQSCDNLTEAPELLATTLAEGCYSYMFSGSGITKAPTLPAITLANNCYKGMFSSCSLLTTPELPAINLAEYCYLVMFYNCTSLIDVSNISAKILNKGCCHGMFRKCTSLTTAPELPATTLAEECYYEMFKECTSLTEAPALPATTLAEGCYLRMFSSCTSLTKAPELPATILARLCYEAMFNGCTSLTTAPELPATILAYDCYAHMFSGCTRLVTVYDLPASTRLALYCCDNMFRNCTSLTKAPELPATSLYPYCYNAMFYGCTNLTTSPRLSATTLGLNCYSAMFYNCKKLNSITMLATSTNHIDSAFRNWVYNVASSGTFTKAEEMTSLPRGVNGIPEGWTVNNV